MRLAFARLLTRSRTTTKENEPRLIFPAVRVARDARARRARADVERVRAYATGLAALTTVNKRRLISRQTGQVCISVSSKLVASSTRATREARSCVSADRDVVDPTLSLGADISIVR